MDEGVPECFKKWKMLCSGLSINCEFNAALWYFLSSTRTVSVYKANNEVTDHDLTLKEDEKVHCYLGISSMQLFHF